MNQTRKLTITALLVAITTVTSHLIYIPVGFAKVFPIQHVVNILSAVLLGPSYAVLQAFTTSLLRNLFGTGSLLAFPGSMIGALLASLLFLYSKKLSWAFFGEVIGTGMIGAICSYPIALLFLGKEVALFGFIPSFIISSLGGAIIGIVLVKALLKTPQVGGILYENSTNYRRF
ncbi:energy coupling factor transporter S component ThiW [Oikeobacillus pervagus]|uniref:Energy coupling factor transporter S component ThiW n=1 Tax=Oikeobacillus pervagus TaxID=1325931 RepID=A0AAJ1SX50_9BACI|nr:energy coupling factor transporter S component ThiW [Oikeobacillus pervagus]MDQ0214390.1 energy coupling factor transporter S component ThiW [Oikeobacillus pervagus]